MAINLKYLAYNILKTDYKKLFEYTNTLSNIKNRSKLHIYKDLIICLYKYKTRFLDYFYFRFFEKETDRTVHTNVWDMHLFHKKYNSINCIIFRDKLKFRDRFKKYFNYPYFELKNIDGVDNLLQWIKDNQLNKLVAKEPLGTVGKGVLILNVEYRENTILINNVFGKEFIHSIFQEGFTLFETFIIQHPDLANIYPKSINTVRIVTFLNNQKEVEVWGTLLRMGYDKSVDNFDAGGLSAKIDIKEGKVITAAKLKDPFTQMLYEKHPITNHPIKGIEIPYWEEVIALVNRAALEVKDVRTVGWDVALTVNGPTLIEGNDNWDKTHFELISEIGLNAKIKELLK